MNRILVIFLLLQNFICAAQSSTNQVLSQVINFSPLVEGTYSPIITSISTLVAGGCFGYLIGLNPIFNLFILSCFTVSTVPFLLRPFQSRGRNDFSFFVELFFVICIVRSFEYVLLDDNLGISLQTNIIKLVFKVDDTQMANHSSWWLQNELQDFRPRIRQYDTDTVRRLLVMLTGKKFIVYIADCANVILSLLFSLFFFFVVRIRRAIGLIIIERVFALVLFDFLVGKPGALGTVLTTSLSEFVGSISFTLSDMVTSGFTKLGLVITSFDAVTKTMTALANIEGIISAMGDVDVAR